MHRQAAHQQWQAASAPPTCSSGRVLPVPSSRLLRAAKSSASRATEDGARQWLAAAAPITVHSRCRPLAAGRDAPLLDAVDFPQGWQGGQRSDESSERHASSANGHSNGAEPSSLAHAATAVAEAIPTTEAARVTADDVTGTAGSDAAGRPAPGQLSHAAGELDLPASGSVSSPAAEAASATDAAADSPQGAEPFQGLGELADIEELRGVRVSVDGNGKAVVEYLVHWKVLLMQCCV